MTVRVRVKVGLGLGLEWNTRAARQMSLHDASGRVFRPSATRKSGDERIAVWPVQQEQAMIQFKVLGLHLSS